ncbi:MAG: hypothetical protein KJ063_07170 [Anaerolineae bacterium]|nr:hypothetical protein [Anaerolineae bacterium]
MPNILAERQQRHIIKPQARKRQPLPADEIRLKSPKNLPSQPEKPGLLSIVPMLMFPLMTGIVGFAMSRLVGGENVLARICLTGLPMIGVAAVTFGVQQYAYRSKVKNINSERDRINGQYLTLLQTTAKQLKEAAHQQQRVLQAENPPFKELLGRVNQYSSQLWERLPTDDDFLSLRLGTGPLPHRIKVLLPEIDEDDPRLVKARELKEEYAIVAGLPLLANLNQLGSMGIRGQKPSEALYLTFTMLASLAVHHSPDDVQIFLLSHRPDAAALWRWLHWLPHSGTVHGQSRISFYYGTDEELLIEQLFPLLRGRELQEQRNTDNAGLPDPHLIVIFDQTPSLLNHRVVQMLLAHTPEQKNNPLRASAIFLGDIPSRVSAYVTLRGTTMEYQETWGGRADRTILKGEAELTTSSAIEPLARRLAPCHTEAGFGAAGGGIPANVRLVELLGANQPQEIDLNQWYKPIYDPEKIMAFPIGLNSNLKPEWLKLREKGQKGDGSHAMLAGMTGQGKSVLLQSMVLSLAIHHSPAYLNFILADFKGGASELAKLQGLPHLVGFVTDLSPALVERFRIAIESELFRRKSLFDSAKERLGHPVANIRTYNKLCPDEPLPHLVLFLDEFAHGLTINERFRPTVDAIAAQGRALGMHLVLSTQRAADFDQKIRPNIEVRLCLRVASAEDSRTMLNRPDAFTRLQRPGQAYIQVGDNERFEMFQSARADTPYLPDGRVKLSQVDNFTLFEVGPDGRRHFLYKHEKAAAPRTNGSEKEAIPLSEAEVLVQHIQEFCRDGYKPARQICLPPLPPPEQLPLFDLIATQPAYARWQGDSWERDEQSPHHRLQLPLAWLDRPARQDQIPFVLDLYRRDGHLLIIGPAGSGKQMILRSLVLSLALTHSPTDAHLYILDRTQTLAALENLPHCAAFIRPIETERITRLFQHLQQQVEERQRLMRQYRVANLTDLREMHPDLPVPALVVIIEDFASFKSEQEDKLEQIQSLARLGRAVDIHLIIAVTALGQVHARIQSEMQNRLAVGLKSTGEYMDVLNKRAEILPEVAGRGYWLEEQTILEMQVAAPIKEKGIRWKSRPATEHLRHLANGMDEAWTGLRPPPIQELPRQLDLAQLWYSTPHHPSRLHERITAPLGLGYDQLAPLVIDLRRWEAASLVVGPPGSGKTEFLLTLALAAAKTMTPEQIEIIVIGLKDQRLRPLSSLPQVKTAARLVQARTLLTQLHQRLQTQAEAMREQQEQSQTGSLELSYPTHTLILVDDLQTTLRADSKQELSQLLDKCLEAGRDSGISLVMADTGGNLAQAKMHRFVQTASQFGCGLVFSVEANDLNLLQLQYKIKQPQLLLHGTTIGKGRGFLSWQGEQVVQMAAAYLDEERDKAISRLIQQIIADGETTVQPDKKSADPVETQESSEKHETYF